MSGPLPLRLCCMAAMAPALTEAATQAKIKLPDTSSAASVESPVVNGRDFHQPARSNSLSKSEKSPCVVKLPQVVKSQGVLATGSVSHLNGDLRLLASQKSATTVGKLSTVKVSGRFKDLIAGRTSSFQNEVIKTLGYNGKLVQRMNDPSSGLRNEEAENCRRQSQNGSNRLPYGDTFMTDLMGGKQQTELTSGQANQIGATKNMCKGTQEGGRLKSSRNNATRETGGQHAQRPNAPSASATSDAAHGQGLSIYSFVDSVESDANVEKMRAEASKKQAQLERRMEFLLRRLRRVQGRQMEGHVRHQLRHFVAYQQNNLQTVTKPINPSSFTNDGSGDLKAELCSDDAKNLSTAALVDLVHRMQASQAVPASSTRPVPSVKPEVTNVLTMADDVRRETRVTAEKFLMNLHFMQSALDSDATESSSGGESCEEDEVAGHHPTSAPLVRRAEWKWAVERAAVASRWTWLQAQVSDLEYRIRQQSDIYKQIRLAKGPVNLGDPPTPQDLLQHVHRNSIETRIPVSAASLPSSGTEVSPCNVSAVMSNVDRQASRLTQSLGNCLSPATLSPTSSMSSSRPRSTVSSPPLTQNGFVESPFSTSGGETDTAESSPLGQSSDQHLSAAVVDLSPVLDPTCRAARCLPLKHPLRKRKLLRTSGLHLMSRKAARLSTIKCHCHHPVMPCVVCSGRVNNMQPLEPDYMPFRERVALLDSSYHHVLSFPEDVPLSVHFEGLLRSGEWQNKPQVRRHRTEYRRQKCLPSTADNRKTGRQFRKSAASVIISSAKIRSKYEHKTGRKGPPARGKRLGKRAMNAELKRRRAAQFAAMGRWRDLTLDEIPAEIIKVEDHEHKSNGLIAKKSPDEEIEDMSDEVYIERHKVCETEEKKRFSTIVKYPPSRRGRGRSSIGLQSSEISSQDFLVPSSSDIGCQPVSMGTQASLDAGELTGEESQDMRNSRCSTPIPQGSIPTFHLPSNQQDEDSMSCTYGGLSVRQGPITSTAIRERLSVSSNLEDFGTDYIDTRDIRGTEPWPLREFPLTDEEVEQLYMEDMAHSYSLRPSASVAVENMSRAESSASGSQPASPVPSSTSASALGDNDAADPEWVAEGDPPRKLQKLAKR
ncbi:hypothetical protein C0Q70_02782 [Pomacea canaliculata]|uniref:PEHE domain-containing protein n=1 Tax=Pomacea canaliculata TaxID=400727 RepID=A0A2T7PQW1_POMCA|nr:hypothetical protein C0Q70_02782 [Pomacea canaliculata]